MMTRIFHRLTRSRTYVLLGIVVLALPLAFAQSSSGGKTEHYTITESDYTYKPDQMTWHVGDTVVLTVKNTSPKDAHMFMMGKKPLNMVKSSFGKTFPKGWGDTLLSSDSQVSFSNAQGVMMKNPSPGGTSQPGAVALKEADKVSGGQAHVTITFKVPDKVGTWHYACFEQKGQHYTSHHMVGTIKIVK
jgi:plastocyanin